MGRKGLKGKARRARDRSRANRLSANQRIADFTTPESKARRGGLEPRMGQRSEFHTEIPSLRSDGESKPRRLSQMQLPLGSEQRTKQATRRVAKQPAVIRVGKGVTDRDDGDSVSNLIRQGAPLGRVAMHPARVGPNGNFSISGFLCGCAIGSAAAAAILVIVAAVM